MSLAAASPTIGLSRFSTRQIALWGAAGALVLAAHVAIAYAVQDLRPAEADGGPPQAQTIAVSPIMNTPAMREDTVPDVVMPDPPNQVEETVTETESVVEPAPEVDKAEPVSEEAEAVPDDENEPTETAMLEQPDQPPPVDEVVPDIAEAVAPDVVVPLPQPRPVEEKPIAKAKTSSEKPRQRVKKERKDKAAPAKAVTTASVDAKPAARASAPKASETSSRSGDSSRWNSQLRSWIKRRTHYPSAAKPRRARGTANVAFVVSASGKVMSARLARSSGDADLDRAAVSALLGATAPKPPPEKAGTSVVAPVTFTLE